MASAAGPRPGVDGQHFRHVAGHLAAGVTVITTAVDTADGQVAFGMTASSVTSLSADPPMMLACLNNAGPTAAAVARSGRYVINVLGERHGNLARRFATPRDDKFAGIAVRTGLLHAPLLDEALAHIECEVVERVIEGTHSIFIGRVVAANAHEGRPLTYFRGGFGRFSLAQEDVTYRGTRDLVVRRRCSARDVITVEGLAAELGVDESSVCSALTRLEADGLVRRAAPSSETGRHHHDLVVLLNDEARAEE